MPSTRVWKSSPAQESSQARNAFASLTSSDRSHHPVEPGGGAGAAGRDVEDGAAVLRSVGRAGEEVPLLGRQRQPARRDGETPTSLRSRWGAAARIRWATLPPIEWPITENRSQPSRSASAITSAAASAVV